MHIASGARIAEVFHSIQGEGATPGAPAVFVRLQGCSVGCRWCDTKHDLVKPIDSAKLHGVPARSGH
jgi:organic radical activating enzyme